jgi:hypothetical protein
MGAPLQSICLPLVTTWYEARRQPQLKIAGAQLLSYNGGHRQLDLKRFPAPEDNDMGGA